MEAFHDRPEEREPSSAPAGRASLPMVSPTKVVSAARQAGLVSASPAMETVLHLLARVGAVDTTVLLSGESGTGKEIAARFLHHLHPRRNRGPWVAVNCGALSHGLVESELFGHVRGAFTGADRDHAGCFERAQGGTLFLDEIGTMRPDHQVRLLRVIQEKHVCRVGGSQARQVDVRVIAATNQNLSREVETGQFRRDLFYRLSVFPVNLPPLRERPEDIHRLADHLMAEICRRLDVPRCRLHASALEILHHHYWPGNVRELQNAMEYATLMAVETGVVMPLHLPPHLHAGREEGSPPPSILPDGNIDLRQAVSRLERSLILESLRRSNGNKARAAELLHLKRTTLVEKMKRLAAGNDRPA